jgi:hypothetical protein
MNLSSVGCPLRRSDWRSVSATLRSRFPFDDVESEHLLQSLSLEEITTKALEHWCLFVFDWVNSSYPWWRFYLLRLENPNRLLSIAGAAVAESKVLKKFIKDCEGVVDEVRESERRLIFLPSDWDEFLISYYKNESEPELSWRPDLIMRQTVEMFHFQRVVSARCSSLSQTDIELLRDLATRCLPSPIGCGDRSVPTLSQLPVLKYQPNAEG